MNRWDSALFNRTFASKDSLKQMFTPQVTYCGSAGTICNASECASEATSCYSYGYGWFLQQEAFGTKLVRSYWHSGLVPGFAAYNAYYPDLKLTLIMLSNLETFANNQPTMTGEIVAKMIRQAG